LSKPGTKILGIQPLDLAASRFARLPILLAEWSTQNWHPVGPAVEHYLTERFHQGIGGQLIRNVGATNDNGANGKVACRSRLGGMLNYYYRDAA
jgi:hypothetical protein